MASRAVLLVRPRLRGWVRPDGTLRFWHPGAWVCALRAGLRWLRVLPRRCPSCNGHGRVVKRRLLRRQRCPVCHGTGWERHSVNMKRLALALVVAGVLGALIGWRIAVWLMRLEVI